MMDPASRARLYGFFSRLFIREVDPRFAEILAGPLGRELLPSFSESPEFSALSAGAEARTLFDSDFAHLTIVNLVPYESFFRRDDGMIESGAENPVAIFYRSYGFEADLEAGRALSPDHLGIELEFMSALCEREALARAEGQEAYAATIRGIQGEFLGSHLLRWAPVYLLAARRNARTMLYRDGADALLHFLLSDHEELSRGSVQA